jgi:hypothetical protein
VRDSRTEGWEDTLPALLRGSVAPARVDYEIEESIFQFPFDICHLALEKSTQAMTNDKRNMGNGKCSPFKVSSLTD